LFGRRFFIRLREIKNRAYAEADGDDIALLALLKRLGAVLQSYVARLSSIP
jgi:hypothetical protein